MEHKCKKTDLKTVEKCELKRDLIIKALECCFSDGSCDGCPYTERVDCRRELERNALSLIKELTEENERLRGCVMSEEQVRTIATETIKQGISIIKADTVRKYREQLHRAFAHFDSKDKFNKGVFLEMADLIAKEILEGV